MPAGEIIGRILGKATSSLVDSIGTALDKNITNKEEKMAAELAVTQEINRALEAERASGIKELELELADVANSRDMNAKIQESEKASFLAKNTGYFLDIFLCVIWGSVTIFIVARALKLVGSDVDMTAILSIYSTITAMFGISLTFHRGTSKGSEDKQKQINKMINK